MNAFHHSSGGTAYTLAVSNAVVSFVSSNFSDAAAPYVRVQVQDDDVYVTYDVTVPSATNGEIVRKDTSAYFLLRDLWAMKFIRVTGNARVFAQPCKLISPSGAIAL
jgi:hypothetical protein